MQSFAERDITNQLIQSITQTGLQTDPIFLVNLYVSLKSKPLAILVGAAGSGKTEVVQNFARSVTGGDPIRCQMMKGHAWWAAKSGDVALFTEAQSRFNASKILAIIEEAWQPENRNRVFVACLNHISRAELSSFFSDLAVQLQNGRITHLSNLYLPEPILYPENLLLIGTLDAARFDLSEPDLLSMATLIHWSGIKLKPIAEHEPITTFPNIECEFLQSLIRNPLKAHRKLCHILNAQQTAHPLLLVENLLNEYDLRLPDPVRGEMEIYLANAWSKEGIGLFDQDTHTNFAIASDFAIAQVLLPRISEAIGNSGSLRKRLQKVIKHFPCSVAFLERLN